LSAATTLLLTSRLVIYSNRILQVLIQLASIMPSISMLTKRASGFLRTPFQKVQVQAVVSRNSLNTRCALSTRSTQHTLNTGAKIPALGFGTFQDADAQVDAVSRALQAGFRLIDTARVYDVEKQVGQGIKESGVPREEIFLGTKLWCNSYHIDDVEAALDESLRDIDTPYVDLLMMHYPCTFARGEDRFPRDANGKMIAGKTHFIDTWRAMEKMVKSGKTKAIGVSNFSKGEIQKLLDESDTVSRNNEPARITQDCRY
jgi:aryl-alcohol dehydrogenase-like predicted oxidoreductase